MVFPNNSISPDITPGCSPKNSPYGHKKAYDSMFWTIAAQTNESTRPRPMVGFNFSTTDDMNYFTCNSINISSTRSIADL
jgi:hypothetical protein